ncbi:hypothetical protein F2Q70_00004872 [Brassica cretica]|uniref:Uncharacterized protein n=1 Tax=Brassica cretica TaxID=69181 RepID=A0A8S9IV94_BRACR|nr:hypothetical protein F2Q70_00004872 [Brassica cretica]
MEPLKLVILGGLLLFEIMGAWKRLMCAKQVISLVETMKLRFFPDLFVQTTYRSVRPDDLQVSLLAVDDLPGSRLVNPEDSFAINF